MAEDCPGIQLNGHSLEIVEKVCYLSDTIGARGAAFDSVITRIKGEQCKYRDLVPFLAKEEACPQEQKTDFILHQYVALCYMEVRIDQLKRKM